MEQDQQNKLPYQLEFDWSGSPLDLTIQLVDDGRERGAGCTDYWLSLFEESAGVCIPGVRMPAADFEDYFRFDPVGSQVKIPESFNPFPFSMTIAQAFDLGFHAADPLAHEFVCELPPETGVPLPTLLKTSPLLEEIETTALPLDW